MIQGSGPMHFTADALVELKDIRLAIRRLRFEDLTPFELQERLNPLIDRLKQVLATGLVPGPPQASENDGEDQGNGGETVPTHEGEHGTTATGPAATATAPTTTGTTPSTTTETTPTTTETTPTTTTGTTTTTP